mmetsp:Transcript_38233/g.50375  ORF Transcript_38233/g.50375 Transcript_38233/m.50375 type:complete len:81 (-) Transcript_38233:420-662(-)
MLHFAPQKHLCGLLHLHQDHGTNLLRRKSFGLVFDIYRNIRLAFFADHFEREQFCIPLDCSIVILPSNKPLHIKNSVLWI